MSKRCACGWWRPALFSLGFLLFAQAGFAQDAASQDVELNIHLGKSNGEGEYGVALQVLLMMTLLTLAPAILMLMTSFTRIVIVLGFVRNALGLQMAPSNQIIIGLSLFLTFFVMTPVLNRINAEALLPYRAKDITSQEAFDRSSNQLKAFMLSQTRDSDLEFFLTLAGEGPTLRSELPLQVALPAFVLSELRTAFQMGFLIFVPFILVDFLVASTLMAMGMMMMPPVVISLPLKLLLFVLVDGWYLVVSSLVTSFQI
jgi:flagellar biosynthetic protein FliP